MPQTKRLIITTSGERAVNDVAEDLRAAGFAVDRVLDEIGCITGAGDEKAVAKARKIRGVTDVSPDEQIDIGPPDSPETW